uniref:Uncharacterized protein n=1 Tax=Anguilla anguilla TaxID=7936 RepID=A0A0E9TJD8_ANGAN
MELLHVLLATVLFGTSTWSSCMENRLRIIHNNQIARSGRFLSD